MQSLSRARLLSVLGTAAASTCGVLWLMHLAHGQQAPTVAPLFEPPARTAQPGGDTTVHASGRNAFSLPASNLADAERTRFVIGNSFFKRNWVEAPASTKARDGLGPHFLARSCGGCHVQDGRAQPPDFRNALGERPPIAGLLLRLSIPGQDAHGGPLPEPVYGDQLNTFGITGVKPEGQVRIRYESISGQFGDGTPYSLEKPLYQITELGYGPLSPATMVSPRIAPQVIGLGLLEAIPESEIHANAAAQAAAPGPIKGQTNLVWDAYGERMMLGRFGWKANVATLAHQTASAFVGDIGITSSRFAQPACTLQQKDCLDAPHGKSHQGVEIDDKALDDVIFYQATLAPPARRNPDAPQVLRGEKLFHAMQCAQCHRPSYRTGQPPFPRLSSPSQSGQTITPYTDLLLHDMGPELADGRPDFMANGRQWRTPPLWGIGLIPDVNGHQRLLHDGRARGVLEAILWHGGEAEAARESVRQLGADDRDALVKFVNSL
ncbi:di-heme oxidoreductase family protein [Comamonas odontotermitis]|uniref:di-heme oxidoreductase family protein n=1 Tax=Comamonas odontotermitis TaxID=379895 RepID=UPI001CC7F1E5|nr:di-heme oxidoredictase family protein [Comamonas odontotermitis]UBB18568.1 c-type cytochrome [Comamonas odontotermitis]